MRSRPLAPLLAVGLGAALLLSGCTGDDDPKEPADAASAPADAPGGDGAKAGAAGSAQVIDAEHPIATQEVPWVDGSTATLDLYGLRVDGETMLVTLGLTPHTDEAANLVDFTGVVADFDVQVIDTANLKRYRIINVDGSPWRTSKWTTFPGETRTFLWAGFAAPEDDIDKADVTFSVGWAPFTDVTIER